MERRTYWLSSIAVTGKRHHYVPQFLLRRFSIDPEHKGSMLYRLDVASGTARKANPVNEAVRGFYYRMTGPDDEINDEADAVLDRFESEAAARWTALAEGKGELSDLDVFWIANFIAILKLRTPEGREQLHQADIRMAELMAEVRLSNPDSVPDSVSNADRKMLLQELRYGNLIFESTPTREVGLMFTGLRDTAEFIASEMTWTLVQTVPERPFIITDHPVAHFDPTPKFEGAGWGYASSANSQTYVPLDPTMALLLEPADRPVLTRREATKRDVEEINLLLYAQAKEAIYGPSQDTVVGVRRFAKAHPRDLARLRLRPPRVWLTRTSDSPAGPIRSFASTYKDESLEQKLFVSREAEREARRHAWPPRA